MGHGSFCSLTLDEVQDQLGNLGKPLGTMNLDELLRSVDSVGAWSAQMHRQGSLTWSRDLSKMTVEEIWRDIQQQNQNQKEADNPWRNAPFGEMTLDDFLVKAGVIAEPTPIQQQESNQWMQIQLPSVQQPEYQNNLMTVPMQGHHVQQSLPVVDAAYPDSHMNLFPSSLIGTLSGTHAPGRKRVAPEDVVEKTVERKQKRMIKNRESAARSRARRQAYTHELEIKVSHLEEENERLRKQKKAEKVLHLRRLLKLCLSYAEQVQPLSDTSFSWLTTVLVQVQDILIDNLRLQISILAGGLYISGFNG